jgi:hypothetical protein
MYIEAQTTSVRICGPTKNAVPVRYRVDFLQLDSLLLSSMELKRQDITSAKAKDSTIVWTTRLLIVLDGKLLSDQKAKQKNLSVINKVNIESIVRINKKKAIELYGKKGKNGALLIRSKNT